MNPAALRSELPALAARGTVIANEDAFSKRNLQKAGYETQPARGRLARRLPPDPDPDDVAHRARGRGDGGRLDARRGARQEPVRARRRVVALRPADGADRGLAAAQVRQQARAAGGQPRRVPRRLELRRDVRADRRPVPRRPGDRRPARHLPQRQRHDGHRARPDRRQRPVGPAAGARQLPDHARVRAAARARAPPGPRRAHDPGRGRDRRRRHGARRGVRRRARRDRDERPGHGPQGRDDRAGGDARAAAGRDRRPARRPVDRDADQDRAVRPADGDPRPPRRVAAAGGRRLDAGPVLRGRLRGGADRGPLPHAGDPALRPVPGQLERAVADPRHRRAGADRSRRSPRRTASRSSRTRATSTARGRGRSPARPAWRTASAGSRSTT